MTARDGHTQGTFGEAVRDFTHDLHAVQRRSPQTVRAYASDLATFEAYLADRGVTALHQISRDHVRSWLSKAMRDNLSRTTISRRASAVRSFFRWCVLHERCTHNPAAGVSTPKREATLPQVPSRTSMSAALQQAQRADPDQPLAVRDRAMFELLYATGMRIAELCALDLGSVLLQQPRARVIGKGRKERIVIMGDPAAEALRDYLRISRPMLAVNSTNTALFLGARGGRIDQRVARRAINALARSAGVPHTVSPHALRHASATHMLDGGADIRVVSEQLGHSDMSSTQIYTHVSMRRLRVTYDESHPRA